MSETSSLPKHVGLILDGNRRWAKDNNLPTFDGHRAGYTVLKEVVKHAVNQGVEYITAYIFSTENWKRSREEVKYLMDLALWVASREVHEVHQEGIRLRFLGRRDELSAKFQKAIDKAENLTAGNTRGDLALCFNYGGQQEIVDATKALMESNVDAAEINEKTFAKYLYAPDIPPVDLIIRTSGEQRISNFMLWRAAYAELYFAKKHWPDFNINDFDEALADYASRQRRFGN